MDLNLFLTHPFCLKNEPLGSCQNWYLELCFIPNLTFSFLIQLMLSFSDKPTWEYFIFPSNFSSNVSSLLFSFLKSWKQKRARIYNNCLLKNFNIYGVINEKSVTHITKLDLTLDSLLFSFPNKKTSIAFKKSCIYIWRF